MGCGISIFDYRFQRNATHIGYGREKQKVKDYGVAQYNSTTGCTKERGEELNGRVVSRKFSGFSSPPKVFLGIARKSVLHGGGSGGEKRFVKAKEEPSANSYNTNEYSIPALKHKKEAVDADDHDDGATRKSEIVVGKILEIKGVEAAILKEPTSRTTKDMIINNAADDDDYQNINNTPTNDDQEDLARARISDYDGPLWIASPSFREYCIADSDSDDDIFNGCRNVKREKIDNDIQLPGDEEEICNVRQASMARQAKQGRLRFRTLLAMHKPKPKPKPKPVKKC